MKNTQKKATESLAVQTKMVLPNDTNPLNTLFGGRLLEWMDEIASISAHKHCGRVVVTASINNVSFDEPIFAGEIVCLHAKVSRAFNSSMEVFIDVFVENPDGSRRKCNEAIYNFVAIDQNRSPISVPTLIPETQIDKQRFDSALRRKQLSLVLAGKLKPEDATELKNALFPKLK
ncbi:MAG: acyl-CoA thioesterase [Flavobacteriales bacterium]|jgi:acyl-CoA hydrolase|tara:strand:+ start:4348 stop:4872 length:525 start_codon:yes stop_codon:yes gene_type:complete